MSFLDNLESNLKNLESREEGTADDLRTRARKDSERATAQAAAGYAEQLKKGPYTAELLRHATRIGHSMRTKVNLSWIGSTLRLEARARRLELRPTPEGVAAVFIENGREVRTHPLDLSDNPEGLAREWLASVPPREETPPDE
jgi:hypothetical protein